LNVCLPIRLTLLAACALSAGAAEVSPPVMDALDRLYNFDFGGANRILDNRIQSQPNDTLAYAFRAASVMFQELDRLMILEGEFFTDDKKIIEKKKLQNDPVLRRQFYQYVEIAKRRAQDKLTLQPADPESLFAMSVASGLLTDYLALIEKRQLASLSYARDSQSYAVRLLRVAPNFTDAYLTTGIAEYLLGSLPFFVKWVVRFDEVSGDKNIAIQRLTNVAANGRCFGAFAKILLSIIHLREKQPKRAETLLAELARDYPENPLIRKELVKVRLLLPAGSY